MATLAYQPRINETFQSLPPIQSMDRARDIDLAGFNELVLSHQDQVYRQALWILGDETAAEDATQEAFLRAYCSFSTFNGGPFRPWILRIVINYCYDQLRRQKKCCIIPLEAFEEPDQTDESSVWLKDPALSVEETYVQAEQQARLMQSIRRLSPEYRDTIILVDIEGMDYQEAARVMGIPLGTFKSRLSRAREQVQVSLKKLEFTRAQKDARLN